MLQIKPEKYKIIINQAARPIRSHVGQDAPQQLSNSSPGHLGREPGSAATVGWLKLATGKRTVHMFTSTSLV
jgi:hypothetical protein